MTTDEMIRHGIEIATNQRVTDANETLRREIADLRARGIAVDFPSEVPEIAVADVVKRPR